MMSENLEKARILWCCRRGMLELDLLLGRFMEQGFDTLNESRKDTFKRILEEPDPDLYAWLMGYEKPESEEFIEFVNWFRTHFCNVKPQ
jgi:antitoxin CptB